MISLGDIKKPKGLTNLEHEQLLRFMGSLIKNKQGIMSAKELFDLKEDGEFSNKILDLDYANEFYNKEQYTEVKFETRAMSKYMCGNEITVNLLGSGKPIPATVNTTKQYQNLLCTHYLYDFFKDKGEIGDAVLYMWYDLFKHIRIQKRTVKGEGLNMYIGGISDMFRRPLRNGKVLSEFSFEYYLGFSRDKLLEKEIELGYINKDIGDENRSYGYTHLLRANAAKVGKIYPANAIRLIMNWSWFNCYVTSRKQGKTSFAADRIVAELFNTKKGYGRHNRKIKFFIDNASTVGNEVMEFIDEIISPYRDKEISPGVKMFNVQRSERRIICNLTGNVFSVVSLNAIDSKKNKSTGEGLSCDCAVIDEGFRLSSKFWKSFRTRARDETDWILFISTLNDETDPNHWAYGELIKGEAGGFETHNTVRSSEFDNTVTYMLRYHMKRQKGLVYRKDPYALKQYENYIWDNFEEEKSETSEEYVLKRFLCGISTEETLFDTTGRITANDLNPKKDDLRIIGLDMGGLSDKFGICVFNPSTLIVERGEGLRVKRDYKDVLLKIKELKEEYPNSIMVGDLGGPVGNTILMNDREKLINYWIKNDGNVGTVNEKDGYYVINKGVQVLSGSFILSNIVKVLYSCRGLLEGFSNMIAKKSRTGKSTLYLGKKGTNDDEVFAYLLVFGFLRQVMNLNSAEEIREFANEYKDFYKYDAIEYDEFEEQYYTDGVAY